jgi:hypothetical protein
MSEAEFRTAFVITSADLGDGHFRHMASTADRRIVNILQAPSSEVDELMISASTDGAELVIATSGRDRIAAGLNGKAVKPAVIKLTGHGKIAAGLTALARRADQ